MLKSFFIYALLGALLLCSCHSKTEEEADLEEMVQKEEACQNAL